MAVRKAVLLKIDLFVNSMAQSAHYDNIGYILDIAVRNDISDNFILESLATALHSVLVSKSVELRNILMNVLNQLCQKRRRTF